MMMKVKIHTLLFLLLFSGLSFGQTFIYHPISSIPGELQYDFIVFISDLFSYKELKLNIEPIEPADTIQFQNEKYQLKYVEIEEEKLGLEDLQTDRLGNIITDNPSGVSYSSYNFGTDYFVIDFFKEPKIVKQKSTGESYVLRTETTYYYERLYIY